MHVRRIVLPVLGLSMLAASQAGASPAETVRCSINDAPARACQMAITTRDGVRHIRFSVAGKRIEFVGRAQSGWWSGKLNGRPVMGFERNRGHVVFSTTDLRTRFSWWYPSSEHGTY